MRKVAVMFILAVFVPSLVLAWLAVRSLRDQQFVLERQRSLIYQGVTDSAARDVAALLSERQHEFTQQVEEMLGQGPASEIAVSFDDRLRTNWTVARVGFVVTAGGEIVCPPLNGRPEARTFRRDNNAFLGNRESAEVYFNQKQSVNFFNVPVETANDAGSFQQQPQSATPATPQNAAQQSSSFNNRYTTKGAQTRNILPQKTAEPLRAKDSADELQTVQQLSKIAPAEAEFQQLIREANEGTLARFVNNKLNLLLWYRSPREARYVFGAQLDLLHLKDELRDRLPSFEPALRDEICIAILDDNAKPMALSHPDFKANWKHPFVATEIGEALPHWEVAAYLVNPATLSQSARMVKLTLGLLIAVLVVAIGVGSWLIVTDLNRQLALARQKTDFVSNVSHELKTPLTSIRMFSELLADGRVTDSAKQRSYLQIITAETARLTRLINNVLDFSRMERGEKKYNIRDCDLVQILRETVESYRPHLENNGFQLECDIAQSTLAVRADCDALAQVIVNLLSNAEKYAGGGKQIAVRLDQPDTPLPCAEVKILDRGPGVPRGSEEKIFEKFYRTHDSLNSGIQGSGLGLTLARQIARAHGGEVAYEPREGGGSCFCLRLPLQFETADERG
jgi:signal transduction histidine kinase